MDNSTEPDPSTWRTDLELRLLELIGRYVDVGVKQQEIINAIAATVERLRREPDHVGDRAAAASLRDVVDEPSNDWPAAQTDGADR
ncbi:hypothetical protein [Rhizobium mesoamericanum]|uniref:Uncharacterized protein n=1 Tax=Rhizobium mesoamericanum STM3625 TaxID=1211777 RepID=K0PK62_9HYPH|nr:hypothetical protein [Rhizobium mesoamericanum]CCM76881.1 conserved hypothetical protein [Rhizobium mesoamericanum STM3625]